MSKQIPLPLHYEPRYTREAWVPTASNAQALAWIDAWPEWPSFATLVVGERASGKTHLSRLWAARAEACFYPDISLTYMRNCVIDDADKIDNQELFHILNIAKEQKSFLLITAATAPRDWATLADLQSRLNSLPQIRLTPPDGEALENYLRALFMQLGVQVTDEALAYVVTRIERSYARAFSVARRLNNESLSQKRPITIPFISGILNEEVSFFG